MFYTRVYDKPPTAERPSDAVGHITAQQEDYVDRSKIVLPEPVALDDTDARTATEHDPGQVEAEDVPTTSAREMTEEPIANDTIDSVTVDDRINIGKPGSTASGSRVMIITDSDDVLANWTVEVTVSNDIPDSELPSAFQGFGRYLHGLYTSKKTPKIIRTLILIFRHVHNYPAITDAERIYALEWIAELYRENFRWSRDKAHLDKCVKLLRVSLVLRGISEGSGKLHYIRSMAVSMVRPGYMDTHAPEYLDYAVMLYGEIEQFLLLHPFPADAITEKTSANTRLYTLDELGYCYKSLYEQRRSPKDLDRAVEAIHGHTKLCENCLASRPVCRHIWGNLAGCYIHRFAEAGNHVDDLEEGVRLYRKCLKSWKEREEGDTDRGLWHANLINALTIRFTRFKQKQDLDEARALELEARNTFEPEDPRYRHSLSHLGNLLQTRSIFLDYEEDLDESIEIYEKMGRSARANLAGSYEMRFKKKRNNEDWYRARDLAYEELNDHPEGDPWRPGVLTRLAMIFSMNGAPEFDLRKALNYRLESLRDNSSSASSRLGNTAWVFNNVDVDWDSLDEDVHKLFLDVLVATMRLLPLAASLGLAPSSRLVALEREDEVVIQAASQAVRLGDLSLALEILEEGRALFWAQALNLRSPFHSLPEPHRGSLVGLTKELEDLNLSPPQSTKVQEDERAARMRRLGKQITDEVDEVRRLPGYERFLSPLAADELTTSADKGPVVILLATRHSCDAIVIKKRNEVSHIKLSIRREHLQEAAQCIKYSTSGSRNPASDGNTLAEIQLLREYIDDRNISQTDALRSTARDRNTSPNVLVFLWRAVVEPVVKELQLPRASGRKRPRLWWCPTGLFTYLPIHAAGVNDSNGSNQCSDYFVSSYTPTLKILLDSRRALESIRRSDIRVLMAAVSEPFRGTQLPNATKEAAIVQAAIGEMNVGNRYQQFQTSADILREMPNATVLHLACHGTQNVDMPLESGFIVKDTVLTISQLMPLSQKQSFMAYLSACETAKGDKRYPDQVVHLAATMLFVGFKSVIGTMWFMHDNDGPKVAHTVYSEILQGSSVLNADDVAYAVDEAVRKLQSEGSQVERWATYIHIGV